jgi:hypothetical protein
MKESKILVSHELLQLIAEIDQFKGKWEAMKIMSPERLRQLRKLVESGRIQRYGKGRATWYA